MCASVRAEVCKHCFVCSLAVGTRFCIALQPVARPEGVTYDKKDGEEIIKLPARPPIVVMAVRCATPLLVHSFTISDFLAAPSARCPGFRVSCSVSFLRALCAQGRCVRTGRYGVVMRIMSREISYTQTHANTHAHTSRAGEQPWWRGS